MVGFLKVGRPYTTPLSLKFFYLSFPHACFLDCFVFVPLFFSVESSFPLTTTAQATLHYHQSFSQSHCASQVHPHLTPFPPGEVSVWGSKEKIEMGIQRLPCKSDFLFFS